MSARFHTTGLDSWQGHRPTRSDAERQRWHGKLLPMQAPKRGLFARIFGGTR